MAQILIEDVNVGEFNVKTTLEFFDVDIQICRKQTWNTTSDGNGSNMAIPVSTVQMKLDMNTTERLFTALQEKFSKWNDMKSLPDEEEYVAVKKDGKIYTELVYRKGDDWYMTNGKKFTKTFSKQFHHWKYAINI